jgi:hypothetical protein
MPCWNAYVIKVCSDDVQIQQGKCNCFSFCSGWVYVWCLFISKIIQ